MTNTRGLDPFPPSAAAGWPPHIRDLHDTWWKAARVVRTYRRRGWNPSAVLFRRDDLRRQLQAAIDEHEHRENNPTLF